MLDNPTAQVALLKELAKYYRDRADHIGKTKDLYQLSLQKLDRALSYLQEAIELLRSRCELANLHYLRQAFSIIRLSFAKSNDLAYYEAGKCMVDLSDMVLAIWNGLPARGMGGTADIVCYALTHHKRIIHINPLTRTVLELSDVKCVDSYCGITLKA